MIITVRGYTGIKPPKMPTEALQKVADEGFNRVCYRYDKTLGLMIEGREGKVDDKVRLVAIQGAYRAMEGAYLAPTVRGVYVRNENPASGELKIKFEAKSKLFREAADRCMKLHGGPENYVHVHVFNPTNSARWGSGNVRPGGYGQSRFDPRKTAVDGIKCERGWPREGTPLREINHDVEKGDPVYQHLVEKASRPTEVDREIGSLVFVYAERALENLDFIKNRSMSKEDYLRLYSSSVGEPDTQMIKGLQWDPKVSNPTEERPRVLYGDSRKQRVEMNKLAEKFLELEESVG